MGAAAQTRLDDGQVTVGAAGIEHDGRLVPLDERYDGVRILGVEFGDAQLCVGTLQIAPVVNRGNDGVAFCDCARREADVAQLVVVLRAFVGDGAADASGSNN